MYHVNHTPLTLALRAIWVAAHGYAPRWRSEIRECPYGRGAHCTKTHPCSACTDS